jgi:hypothetical protein
MKSENKPDIMKAPFLALLFSALTIHAAEFDFGSRGVLSIDTPEKWTVTGQPAARQDGTQIGYALAIKPVNDANAKCLVTFAYVKKGQPDRESIRKDVLRASEQFVAGSVEKKQNLNDFSLKQGYGAYCLFTDASLVGKPSTKDDYKVMGSGIVQLSDEVLGVVSIFADEVDGKDFKALLAAINSFKLKNAK